MSDKKRSRSGTKNGRFIQRQAIVIGLGQFGMAVARALAERGVEVLAVDINQERVRQAAQFTADAACFDASNADALAQTAPDRRDVCLCAIGDESREASIIVTALLRQMGAPRVIARANTDVHARILALVGADQVVNPEREFGERFATNILHRGILGEMPLGKGVLITEAEVQTAMVGRKLRDLELPGRFGITVIAIRKVGQETVILPRAGTVIDSGDVLVVVGREGAVTEMMDWSEKHGVQT